MGDRRREILEAALHISDADGVDAISMRAVARRVGVTPMALYSHVDGKGALLDGLVEMLLTDLPVPEPGAGWQERLAAVAHGLRSVARRHPSAFGLLFARPTVTADATRVIDGVFAILLDAGVPAAEVPRVERMLSTFVIGYAVSEVNGRFGAGSQTPRERRTQLPAGELPAHHRLAGLLDTPVDWDAEFRRDLDNLVDLIEVIADHRGTDQKGGPVRRAGTPTRRHRRHTA